MPAETMGRLTYVGHGAVLVEMDGVRVATDPVLRRWMGPLLRRGPLPDPGELHDLDAVLITHLHIDHLDVPSLRLLPGDPLIVVPRHGVELLRRKGFRHVVGMTRGGTQTIGQLTLTATYARHSGRRGLSGSDGDALGFVIGGSAGVYVAGDTGEFPGMADLAGCVDVACLPIDGWGLRLPDDHLNPLTAAKALRLLDPKIAVPIHWGTYYFPGLPQVWRGRDTLPPRAFARYAAHLAPHVEVHVLPPGTGLALDSGGGMNEAQHNHAPSGRTRCS